MLDEIAELSLPYRDRRPDAEITIAEYAEKKDISVKRSERALKDLVMQGKLATEMVMNGRHITRVFWIVDA